MSDRKVKVESLVKYTVVLSEPDLHFNRTFNKEMQSALIDYDVMVEGLQKSGFRYFFRNGTLRVADKQDRIDLELEAKDADDEIEEIVALNTGEMIKLMKSADKKNLEETLKKSTSAIITRFIKTAISAKIYDYNVTSLLQKYAEEGTDIQKLIALAEAAEKPIIEENE
jgi:hypothetical protein